MTEPTATPAWAQPAAIDPFTVVHTLDKTREDWKREMFLYLYGRGPTPAVDYRTIPRGPTA